MDKKFVLFQEYLNLKQQYQEESARLQALEPHDKEYAQQKKVTESIRKKMLDILKKLEKLR